MNANFQLPISTAQGVFLAHYSENGLTGLDFPDSSTANAPSKISESGLPSPVRRWHQLTTLALSNALAGRAPRQLPPLDLSAGTGFQQRVWKSLLRIGTGRTRSYGEVAIDIGSRRATRAVGGACGANPIPVLVPCHRVLAANQRLGGFSSGLDWKRKLLALEGITVRQSGSKIL
jgi:methylated-DNA-[protein]-cysteine S-methyltransferase